MTKSANIPTDQDRRNRPAGTDLALLKIHAGGLSRDFAAVYVGVGVTKFDEMVEDGRMPKPKRVDGRKIWLRSHLDLALDALPDDREAVTNPLDGPS